MRPVKSTGNSRAQCAPGCFFVWVEVEITRQQKPSPQGEAEISRGQSLSRDPLRLAFCANLAADAANLTADTRDVSNPKFHPDFAQHRAGRNAAKNRDTPAKRRNNGVEKQDFQAGANPVRQIHLLPGNSMAENLSISI